jgi:signal peptidase I
MRFDFPLILVLATAFTGLVWAIEVLWWQPRRLRAAGGDAAAVKEPVIVEYSRSFFPVILAVLVLRSFIAEPFRIPSASMVPTLLVGDFILVNKYAYGVRLPVADTKVIAVGAPARGDVVVFRYPPDPTQDYIKRVVGLPGDRIEYRAKTLWVNGEQVASTAAGVYTGPDAPGARLAREMLGAAEHAILTMPGYDGPEVVLTVPAGHYFVMGDNRDNSRDSRSWGFVPEANLVGKAFFIWMSWKSFTSMPAWDRIGNRIE